ncbi:MAG: alpha/beta hydrolase [Phycisphaerae bacterium]|nr:alpha/beta hydrolase [Gemmatimonadaceae bacterium]
MHQLPFRSIVVSSDNDIYISLDRAQEYASASGSQFVLLPGAGQINAASNLGRWTQALELLDTLRAKKLEGNNRQIDAACVCAKSPNEQRPQSWVATQVQHSAPVAAPASNPHGQWPL